MAEAFGRPCCLWVSLSPVQEILCLYVEKKTILGTKHKIVFLHVKTAYVFMVLGMLHSKLCILQFFSLLPDLEDSDDGQDS